MAGVALNDMAQLDKAAKALTHVLPTITNSLEPGSSNAGKPVGLVPKFVNTGGEPRQRPSDRTLPIRSRPRVLLAIEISVDGGEDG